VVYSSLVQFFGRASTHDMFYGLFFFSTLFTGFVFFWINAVFVCVEFHGVSRSESGI
jgi:hypothetical protein